MTMQRPTDPRQLPELVAEIARDDTMWAAQQALSLAMGRKDFEHPENIRQWVDEAKLWWIDEDACDLIEYAAPSMPSVTLTYDLVPSPAGFIAFARPLLGISEFEDQSIDVDYILWYPSMVEGEDAISIVCWNQLVEREYSNPLALGRSDWPLGAETDATYEDGILDRAVGGEGHSVALRAMQSIIEDRRWVAAAWQLAAQKGLTASRITTADRASFKRIHRMGGIASPVRVIHLPHRERATAGSGGSRHYHHRWIVGFPGGYWRRQHYGPGGSLVKALWIKPYWKGPKGAPVLPPRPTVQVVHGRSNDE
jgi:hypothetical protein